MGEKKIDKYVFNVKNKAGEGSYATVYKGVNEKTGEKVAIKMLSKSVINADDYLREGLIQEIKIMQKLKSPNIVQLLDVMETSNNYYIVQEFCDGGDFDELLKKRKILSEKEAIKFLVDVLNGFTQLIKNGITHRDLKPANILIDKATFKLADFGFAKCVDNFKKDMMSSMVGTPLYMSPQILDHKRYNSKTDVWSIGFIFYEALFGKTPWTARSPAELLKNIRSQPLKFPTDKIPVSQETLDLIIGCLQPDESKRFSWDEIYKHPAVAQYFTDFIKGNSKLEDKAQYLINDIRLMIIKDKLDLTQLFAELDMSKDKALDVNELGRFLTRVDKDIQRDEIEYIFNKFDEDGSNSIEFEEFKKWLEDNSIHVDQEQQNRDKQKKQSLLQKNNVEERANYVIEKLKLSIIKYNIQLIDLFKKFDKSADLRLDIKEMGMMLKRIEPNITEDETKTVFDYFDINKDGEITFQEFQTNLEECIVRKK
ncbi:unnamed protein product (macronuclear) [Paramecium tetraurelia]|uniref:Uncharacterized protein n=1 Tax=Paramecium tetraurelia TaxID=5888 RepID=A0C746_PARTE|nr:uncharacterized protein GSPATT00035743001 [Paramecium tetraurelia]CAK66613.1 unnamed protein product [Paramecium tetraurelia]|eukprot:XP_001434010.1 hypothetical protein (macronuclear) [Paramecium tetraurelia strain d4-2]